jgi:hypothetical protein
VLLAYTTIRTPLFLPVARSPAGLLPLRLTDWEGLRERRL